MSDPATHSVQHHVRIETDLGTWVGAHILSREEGHTGLSPMLGHLHHLIDR